MKRTVITIPCNAMKPTEAAEIVLGIQEPGNICDCLLTMREAKTAILSAAEVLEAKGKPVAEFVPTILVEVDPDARTKARNFLIVPPGQLIETEHTVMYRGRFLFPYGLGILLLFEEFIPWKHPDDKGGVPLTYCRRCGHGVGFWEASDEGPCHCTQEQIEDYIKEHPEG